MASTNSVENNQTAITALVLNRRHFITYGTGVAVAGLLAACGGDSSTPASESGSESSTTSEPSATSGASAPQSQVVSTEVSGAASPTASSQDDDADKRGGTITIAVADEPQSMDNFIASPPASGEVYDNIFDGLTRMEQDGSVVPALATGWSVVEPTRWRFPLQPNATWQNGDPFTADDIRFHFDRVFVNGRKNWPALLAPSVDHAEIHDDHTIDVITKTPDPMLPNNLAPRWEEISSNPTAVKEWGDQYGEHPVGTGPFNFVEWKKGESLTLAANDDYWDGRPYLDKVVFRFIPEDASRLLALQNGSVDFVYTPPRHQVAELEQNSDYKVLKAITFVTEYVCFNCTDELFRDVRVRNAIAYAINKDEIVQIALDGQGAPANELVSPGIAGYDENLGSSWPFDLEKAKSLLAEAGWVDSDGDGIVEKDGKKFTVEYSYALSARYPAEISTVLQAQLKKLGIDVKLHQWESAAFLDKVATGALSFFNDAQGLGTGQFGQLAYPFFHTGGGHYGSFLSDVDPDTQTKLDELVDSAGSEFDAAAREDAWHQIMMINREQALLVPVYHPLDLAVVSSKVMDAYLHPGEYLRMKRVWIKK